MTNVMQIKKENIKNYCPTCQKIVEYEFSHDDYFCSICGRTKKVAEEKVKYDKHRVIAKTIKFTLKTIGIILFLLMILWGWAIAPDRMRAAAARGSGYVGISILILIGSGIFYGIKAIINKSRKR